jgi:hypothetical protein
MYCQLTSMLTSSCVLEHAAQGLVVLAGRPECGRAMVQATHLITFDICSSLVRASQMYLDPESRNPYAPPAAVEDLAAALRPPGVQHLLSAGGLLVLRELDGGPVYGLDTELYGRVLPLTHHVPMHILVCAGDLWYLMTLGEGGGEDQAAVPPFPSGHVWCSTLLRVVDATVTWWAIAGPDPVFRRVPTAGLAALLRALRDERTSDEQRQQQQWAEAWRLLLRCADCVLAGGEGQDAQLRRMAPLVEGFCREVQRFPTKSIGEQRGVTAFLTSAGLWGRPP